MIKFNNGLIKIIVHDTNMTVPIQNTLSNNIDNKTLLSELDINKLNNLNFQKVNDKKFPVVKILNKLPPTSSLYEALIVSTNDKLVDLFLNNLENLNTNL